MIAAFAALLLAGVFFGGGLFQEGYIKSGLALAGWCAIALGFLFAAIGEIASRSVKSLPAEEDEWDYYDEDFI